MNMNKAAYAKHLEGCFIIMSDTTRYEPDDSTTLWYIETWFEEGLPPGAVIQAVKELMRDWTGSKWPGPGLISKQARQVLNRDLSTLAGDRVQDSALEQACIQGHNMRWDSRERRAEEFIKRHRSLLPALGEEVKKDAAKWLRSLDLTKPGLAERRAGFEALKKGFMEGALMGLCLELERLEDTKAGQERIDKLYERAAEMSNKQLAA